MAKLSYKRYVDQWATIYQVRDEHGDLLGTVTKVGKAWEARGAAAHNKGQRYPEFTREAAAQQLVAVK